MKNVTNSKLFAELNIEVKVEVYSWLCSPRREWKESHRLDTVQLTEGTRTRLSHESVETFRSRTCSPITIENYSGAIRRGFPARIKVG